jgi:hypothetical protein
VLSRAAQEKRLTRLPKRALSMAGVAVGVLLLLWVVVGDSAAENAVEAVERASPSERNARETEARKALAKVTDKAERSYLTGRLEESLGRLSSAASHYQQAIKAGSSSATGRILDWLEHAQCERRELAAETAGSLKLKKARSRLKDLAENGGEGDGEKILMIGCDSKSAAVQALKRLE